MFSPHLFRAFSDEVAKLASGISPHAAEDTVHHVAELVRKVKPRDAALVAGGAGAFYGGQRLVNDVRMGEQMRQNGYNT
jgi:hypothetical protein